MKTIIIDDVFEFDKIGEGAEGEVFKIDDDTVYKYLKHRKTREDKIKKIKYLKNIDLEKFVQIKDIVSDGYVEIGYTMKLVKTNSIINVKKALNDEISLNEKIEYIKSLNDCQHSIYDYLRCIWLPELYKQDNLKKVGTQYPKSVE